MLGAVCAIATAHVLGRTKLLASPTDAFRMSGFYGYFRCHGEKIVVVSTGFSPVSAVLETAALDVELRNRIGSLGPALILLSSCRIDCKYYQSLPLCSKGFGAPAKAQRKMAKSSKAIVMPNTQNVAVFM